MFFNILLVNTNKMSIVTFIEEHKTPVIIIGFIIVLVIIGLVASNSGGSNVNPTHSTVKPTHSTVKPAHSTVKPAHSTVKPTHSTVKPTHSTVKPAHSTVKPAHSTVKPAHSTVKPTHSTVKPTHSTVKPAHSIKPLPPGKGCKLPAGTSGLKPESIGTWVKNTLGDNFTYSPQDGLCTDKGGKHICNPQVCPLGFVLGGTDDDPKCLEMTKDNTSRALGYVGGKVEAIDTSSCPTGGTGIDRGICHSSFPAIKPNKLVTGSPSNMRTRTITQWDSGKQVTNTFTVPVLGLYHGGLVGDAADGTTAGIYQQYLQDVLRFALNDKVAIDVILAVMNTWSINSTQGKYDFAAYCNPQFLADNFVTPVQEHNNKNNKDVKVGLVPYVRPKDGMWAWDLSLPGTADPMNPDSDKTTFSTLASCPLVSPVSPCPIKVQDNCIPNCSTNTSCNFTSATPSKENFTSIKPDTSGCGKVDDCYPQCPKGCPNIGSQLLNYMSSVNKLIKAPTGKEPLQLTYVVFDGEDAGPYNSSRGFCELTNAALDQNVNLTNVGFAKALNSGLVAGGFNNIVMPETYWYMNELWPCAGNATQMSKKPDVCGPLTSYRWYANRPKEFLNFIQAASESNCGGDTNYLNAMEQNIKAAASMAPRPVSGDSRSYTMAQPAIWPMFSLENLTMSGTSPAPGNGANLEKPYYGAPNCIANNYSGIGSVPKDDVCGTFDGFAYWNWESFLDMCTLFAHKYGVNQVGIYESQFIPPSWMPDSNGSLGNGQYTNNCIPVVDNSCPGVVSDRYICDNTEPKKGASSCMDHITTSPCQSKYYAECKTKTNLDGTESTSGTCSYHRNKGTPITPCVKPFPSTRYNSGLSPGSNLCKGTGADDQGPCGGHHAKYCNKWECVEIDDCPCEKILAGAMASKADVPSSKAPPYPDTPSPEACFNYAKSVANLDFMKKCKDKINSLDQSKFKVGNKNNCSYDYEPPADAACKNYNGKNLWQYYHGANQDVKICSSNADCASTSWCKTGETVPVWAEKPASAKAPNQMNCYQCK